MFGWGLAAAARVIRRNRRWELREPAVLGAPPCCQNLLQQHCPGSVTSWAVFRSIHTSPSLLPSTLGLTSVVTSSLASLLAPWPFLSQLSMRCPRLDCECPSPAFPVSHWPQACFQAQSSLASLAYSHLLSPTSNPQSWCHTHFHLWASALLFLPCYCNVSLLG